MGLCGAKLSAEQRAELERSKKLEEKNETDFRHEQTKFKLLLLGAGESGKSTIFKQMKILYGVNFTEEERRAKRTVVFSNTISAMKALIEACEMLNIAIEDRALATKFADEVDDEGEIDEEVGTMIETLWADSGIKEAYNQRAQFQLPDSASYFFESLERIKAPSYVPSVDDILRTRVRTSGIITEQYEIDDHIFEMYDVGGQRNERRKWIHCFDNVTAIIFVAALSEYDQVLYEDNTENRMVEAVNLFDEICNSPLFQSTTIMLFLNKEDLFREKIERVDIRQPPSETSEGFFLDYEGGCDYDKGLAYLTDLFLSRKRSQNQTVMPHVTTATNTENVRVVFDVCKQELLRQSLEQSGFM